MKPPAFQFYAADFLVGTLTMTNEEVGIYIRLLCHQWDKGFIPADKAARLVCVKKLPADVLAKFTELNGELRNERLERERRKQAEYREQQSQRGKAGAESRWSGTRHASANGETMASPSSGQCPNDGTSVSGLRSSFSSSKEDPESGSGASMKPENAEDRLPSVFADLTEVDLRDDSRLAAWFRGATQRQNPIVSWSEVNLLNVFAVAAHAMRQKKIQGQPVRSRVGFFSHLILKAHETGKWDVSADDEDDARRRIRRLTPNERTP
jgi:uncharacterized protein YdaU (DUF1376 family)